MDEHLKRAKEEIRIVGPMSIDPKDIKHLSEAVWHLIQHLESAPVPPHNHIKDLAEMLTKPQEAPDPFSNSKPWVDAVRSARPQEAPQASEESSPTTASRTTARRWVVAEATVRQMLESWRWGQVTTEYVVGRLFECAALRGALPDDEQILALAAVARTSTSANPASRSSAAPESSATSRGGSSKRRSIQCSSCGTWNEDDPELATCWSCMSLLLRPAPEPSPAPSHEAREWRPVLRQCVEALRLTREYVGGETLPAIAGWSWYDATVAAKELLDD